MNLDYSNFFGRYRGDSVEEILAQLHAEAQKVGPISYFAWKEWNRQVWKERYCLDAPVENTPEAEAAFLAVLVKVGAIYPTDKTPQAAQILGELQS